MPPLREERTSPSLQLLAEKMDSNGSCPRGASKFVSAHAGAVDERGTGMRRKFKSEFKTLY